LPSVGAEVVSAPRDYNPHLPILVLLLLTLNAEGAERAAPLAQPENLSLPPAESPAQPLAPSEQPASSPPASPVPERAGERGFDLLPLPVLTFNSDTGFGGGLVLSAHVYGKDYRPYRHGLTAQFFVTTSGFQGHYLTWDAPHLLGPVRLEAHLEFHKDLYAPYYGPGNHTFPGQSLNGPDRSFGYLNVWTWEWIRFRVKPLGDTRPLTLYAGYQYRYFWISPYASSVLAQQSPRGIHGGRDGSVFAGILWDRRDDEQNTRRGYLVQFGGRMARHGTASLFDYQGLTFGTRLFWSLGTPRLVLALRGEADHLWGDLPFWEWNQLGGISSIEGLGGLDTVRGVPRNRYGGNTKVLGNVELRWATVQIPWGPAPVEIGLLGFIDTGRVWQPGQPDGKFFDSNEWHSGTGGGLRIARRAAVIRADFGVDLETGRTGVYVAFGQLF
jgi:hypothetical protein